MSREITYAHNERICTEHGDTILMGEYIRYTDGGAVCYVAGESVPVCPDCNLAHRGSCY